MNVDVTQEDIDKGKPNDGWYCPLAMALWRATKQRWDVHRSLARAIERPPRRMVALPNEARHFNELFDRGVTVRPFSFEFKLEEATTTP